MKKIYLIRHGQTEYNRKGIVQGSGIDSSLNEVGRFQAEAFYRAYRHIPFDQVYTSVLQRTIQSVQEFLSDGLPHTKLAGLNEINWGKKEGQVASAEDHVYYHSVIKSWRQGELDNAIEGGESPRMVLERQKPALMHILAQPYEENVLVCMHGRAMRILLCLMLEHDLRHMDDFPHGNLCLYLLQYDQDSGKFYLELANEQSHIPKLPPRLREEMTELK